MFKNRESTTMLAVVTCLVCAVLGIFYGLNYYTSQTGLQPAVGEAAVSGTRMGSPGTGKTAGFAFFAAPN